MPSKVKILFVKYKFYLGLLLRMSVKKMKTSVDRSSLVMQEVEIQRGTPVTVNALNGIQPLEIFSSPYSD